MANTVHATAEAAPPFASIKSVKEGLEFFHRAPALQSPHAISRAYDHLITLEEAGYADVKSVQDFRDKLNQAQMEQQNASK